MRTSMTEREKESSSAAVKRPQQPKEILEKKNQAKRSWRERASGRGNCSALRFAGSAHGKRHSKSAAVTGTGNRGQRRQALLKSHPPCQDPKIRRGDYSAALPRLLKRALPAGANSEGGFCEGATSAPEPGTGSGLDISEAFRGSLLVLRRAGPG